MAGVEATSKAAYEELCAYLGFNDVDGDGVIELGSNDVDKDELDILIAFSEEKSLYGNEGYRGEVDINRDGKLIKAEVKYYAHFLFRNVSFPDTNERIKRENPFTQKDRKVASRLFAKRIKEIQNEEGIHPTAKAFVLADIALEMAKGGLFQEALTVARSISLADYSSFKMALLLTDIASEMTKAGIVKEEIIKVLQEALVVARNISLKEGASAYARDYEAYALQYIALAMAKAGLFQEALTVARSIDKSFDIDVFLLIPFALVMARAGFFQEAIATAIRMDDNSHRRRAWSLIHDIAELLKVGTTGEEAGKTFSGAAVAARNIDDSAMKAEILQAIALGVAKTGMAEEEKNKVFQEAATVAKTIDDSFEKARTFRTIVLEMAKGGLFQEALTVARSIDNSTMRDDILRDIALEMAKVGLFQEAVTAVKSIDDRFDRTDYLSALALEMAKAGLFQEALVVARSIDMQAREVILLKTIALEMAKAGLFQEAVAVAGSINMEVMKAEAIDMIVSEMTKAGMNEEEIRKVFGAAGAEPPR